MAGSIVDDFASIRAKMSPEALVVGKNGFEPINNWRDLTKLRKCVLDVAKYLCEVKLVQHSVFQPGMVEYLKWARYEVRLVDSTSTVRTRDAHPSTQLYVAIFDVKDSGKGSLVHSFNYYPVSEQIGPPPTTSA